jgi:hypothetical protein
MTAERKRGRLDEGRVRAGAKEVDDDRGDGHGVGDEGIAGAATLGGVRLGRVRERRTDRVGVVVPTGAV